MALVERGTVQNETGTISFTYDIRMLAKNHFTLMSEESVYAVCSSL